ncbi:MAG TPA: hypothetical protein VIH72_11870, partial [Candidatus Acidoferrales bacterium]
MKFAGTTSARFLAFALITTAALIANANAKQSTPAKSPQQSKSAAQPKTTPAKAVSTAPEI